MAKILKLTESDLTRIVNKVMNEQLQDVINKPGSPKINPYAPSSKPQVRDNTNAATRAPYPSKPGQTSKPIIVPCSKLGIKSLGSCDQKTKRPVDYCSALGVKSPGFCFVDTKQPM